MGFVRRSKGSLGFPSVVHAVPREQLSRLSVIEIGHAVLAHFINHDATFKK
jgi:hypothetical protein